jgi:aminoglycoside phosphotransferase (APT) family kinase protein
VSVADGLDGSAQKRICETLGAELGRLHALNHDELRLWPPGSGDDPAGELLGYIEHWRALWQEAYVPGFPAIEAAFDWLGANVPADLERLAIVHSDFGLHNVLADGDEVTAILDWEFAHLGEPAEDLEYVRAGIEPLGCWEHFLSSYLSAGGPEPVPGRARFYRVWRSQRNAVCCALGLQAFESGANPDLRMAYIGRVLLPMFAGMVAGELDSPGREAS